MVWGLKPPGLRIVKKSTGQGMSPEITIMDSLLFESIMCKNGRELEPPIVKKSATNTAWFDTKGIPKNDLQPEDHHSMMNWGLEPPRLLSISPPARD